MRDNADGTKRNNKCQKYKHIRTENIELFGVVHRESMTTRKNLRPDVEIAQFIFSRSNLLSASAVISEGASASHWVVVSIRP